MADTIFLAALNKTTDGECTLGDLITAASALVAAGRDDLAIQLYKVWIGLNPRHPQRFVSNFNMASLLAAREDLPRAMAALNEALSQNASFHPAYINLGGLIERSGNPDGAVEKWKEVINRLSPITGGAIEHKLTAFKQIGRVLIDAQRSAAAEAWLRPALEIRPDQRDVLEQFIALRLAQCEWPVIANFEGVDRRNQMMGISPLSLAAYTDDPLLHLATAAKYVEATIDPAPADNPSDRRHAEIDLTGRRMRIGYVSSDLRDHAVGYLMAELMEVHDRAKVEVFAYYCGPEPSGATYERYRASVEHWVDITKMDDATAAAQVAADGIDILVDVNGLTRFARTAVFARRPAPIQVNWLGYPGSMGSPYHHYIVADDWIIPEGSEIYYAEKVLRLPCYQSNDRKRAVAERRRRSDYGLPEDAFVFCCFNGSQKFTRFTVDRWLEILRQTPGSVLWLLETSPDVNGRLQDYAEANGVARERLIFAGKLKNEHHLARYPLADLFLDSSPYGAHTTASDALWMGVPVLTLSGRGFAARVCGSLVRAAGLPELICETAEDYVARAVELAGDPAEMMRLRAKLEAGKATCVLFDMDKLSASLEDLYGEMIAAHQAGATPQPDLTNLDIYKQLGAEEDHEAREMRAVADYTGLYLEKLARRHRERPIPADQRLWTAEAVAKADAPPQATAPASLKDVA
jgi:predicted O-linked N-acetylglucosamine transferase (SPINDLY family)